MNGSDADALFFVGLLVVVATAVLVVAFLRDIGRASAFRKAAANLGLTYRSDNLDFSRYPIPLFHEGPLYLQGTDAVLVGTWQDFSTTVCSYWYKFVLGKVKNGCLCALAELPAGCHATEIDHHGAISRVADVLTAVRLEVELSAFDRAYRVQTADRQFAAALLDGEMVEWLVAHDQPSVHYEVGGTYAACVSTEWGPDQIPRMLELLAGFTRRIPAMAYELGARPVEPAHKNCSGCGSVLAPGANFCSSCGAATGKRA